MVEITHRVRQKPPYNVKMIGVYVLAMQGARASTTVLLTMLNRHDSVPARWGLMAPWGVTTFLRIADTGNNKIGHEMHVLLVGSDFSMVDDSTSPYESAPFALSRKPSEVMLATTPTVC